MRIKRTKYISADTWPKPVIPREEFLFIYCTIHAKHLSLHLRSLKTNTAAHFWLCVHLLSLIHGFQAHFQRLSSCNSPSKQATTSISGVPCQRVWYDSTFPLKLNLLKKKYPHENFFSLNETFNSSITFTLSRHRLMEIHLTSAISSRSERCRCLPGWGKPGISWRLKRDAGVNLGVTWDAAGRDNLYADTANEHWQHAVRCVSAPRQSVAASGLWFKWTLSSTNTHKTYLKTLYLTCIIMTNDINDI